MKLTTGQVAEKLGVSRDYVRKLRDEGKLHDLRTRREGAKKIFSIFDSKEVTAFAKTFAPSPYQRAVHRRNGAAAPPQPVFPVSISSRLAEISERLERIENGLDALIKVWS